MNFSLRDHELMDFGAPNGSLGIQETLLQTNVSGENELTVFEMPNPEEMLNPAAINPQFLHIIITHSLTFVVGLLGNVFVVTIMVGDRKSRNATNLFLVR